MGEIVRVSLSTPCTLRNYNLIGNRGAGFDRRWKMEDESEIVKATAEGTVSAIVKPFSDLLLTLLGGATEEAGDYLRWRMCMFRESRRRRFEQRTMGMFEAKGKEPAPLPLTILLPILEQASIEEDDDLQDRWAALLVSCSGEKTITMPAAPDILKQLNKWEIMLLQRCYDSFQGDSDCLYPFPKPEMRSQARLAGIWANELGHVHHLNGVLGRGSFNFQAMLDNVVRLGLLQRRTGAEKETDIYMTSLGYKFVSLCQPTNN